MSEINNTLNERGERYGKFKDVAGMTQQLMSIVERGANYEHLNAEQKTSLFMICNKMARIVNGDHKAGTILQGMLHLWKMS